MGHAATVCHPEKFHFYSEIAALGSEFSMKMRGPPLTEISIQGVGIGAHGP